MAKKEIQTRPFSMLTCRTARGRGVWGDVSRLSLFVEKTDGLSRRLNKNLQLFSIWSYNVFIYFGRRVLSVV